MRSSTRLAGCCFRGADFLRVFGIFLLLLWIVPSPTVLAGTTTAIPSATRKAQREPVTSLERPPVVTQGVPESAGRDELGVTFPPPPKFSKTKPKFSKTKSKFRNAIETLDLWGSFKRFKSAFTKMKKVMTKASDGVGEGRYMEGWMEGAMVPMTFLLMAAFIMDILQRLFPLPYATFVNQAYNRGTTPKPVDLTKISLNTPLGNFGVETNEKNGFNLFGRSNQGNPGFESTGPNYSTYSSDDPVMNMYLNSLLSANQSQQGPTVTSDVGSYGIPIIGPPYDGSPYGSYPEYGGGSTYVPGSPGEWTTTTTTGTTGSGGNTQPGGTNGGGSSPGTTGGGGGGGGGYGGSPGTSGGYGSSQPAPTTGNGGSPASPTGTGGYSSGPTTTGTSNSRSITFGGEEAASSDMSFNGIPLDGLDLIEYYSRLNSDTTTDGQTWKRRKRSG